MGWFNAGVQALADETILSGKVPPFIIVATDNLLSDPLANTVYLDVMPAVEKKYRVLSDLQYRSVAGGSLGGIRAYQLALNNPNTFATVALFGSGIVSGEEERVKDWLAEMDEPMRFFFNTGYEDPLMLEQAEQFVVILDEAGVSSTAVYTTGDHSYQYWITNMASYWEWVAEDWE